MPDAGLTFWEDSDGRIITDAEGAPVLCDSCPPMPPEPETGWWVLVSCDGSTYDQMDNAIRGRLVPGYGTFTSPYPPDGTVAVGDAEYPLGSEAEVPVGDYGSTLTGSLHVIAGPYPDETSANTAISAIPLPALFERVAMRCNPVCGFATPVYARVIVEFEYNSTDSDGSTARNTSTYDRIQTWDSGRWILPQNAAYMSMSDDSVVGAGFTVMLQYPSHVTSSRTDSNSNTTYGEGDLDEGPNITIAAVDDCSTFRLYGDQMPLPSPDGSGGISWPAFSPPTTRNVLWGPNNSPLNDLSVDETIVDEISPDYVTHRTQTLTASPQDDSMHPFPTIDISFAWSDSFSYPGGGMGSSVSGRIAVIPIFESDFNTLAEYEYARQQLLEELQ